MTTTTEALLAEDIARHLTARAFACPSVGHRVGLELEWHVYDPGLPSRRLTPAEVRAVAEGEGPLAPGVTTSVEPGGQVELDTPPLALADGCRLAGVASEELQGRLRSAGLQAVAVGADPHREPANLLDVPRYRAMATAFGARGVEGVQMMANTAAFQVNIDLDPEGERWRLAHQFGPVLVAAFANSPVGPDGATGDASHRLTNWWAIDPTRTRPVAPLDEAPAAAWYRYALDANVLLIRRGGDAEPVIEPLSFADWLRNGHPLGPPTVDDFAYHLTTLFPPIRPRGYLELRFLDALDHPHWLVAAALVAGLLDEGCQSAAAEVTEPATGRWMDAARLGLADEELAGIADDLTELALEGLTRQRVAGPILDEVRRWRDTELADRRTPGASVLSRWEATGTVLPDLGGYDR